MRLVAAVAIGVALSCTATAQSLADVAKRTEEERAKAAAEKKEPTKVITNSDLKPHPRDAEANAAAAAEAEKARADAESKPAAKKTPAEKTDPKQTEAYWKRRAKELHAQLDEDEKRAKEERDKLERFRHNTESVGCLVCPARNQLESQLIRMDEEQTKLDAKVAADRAAIQEFEEDGRRLGILPGWLRPR